MPNTPDQTPTEQLQFLEDAYAELLLEDTEKETLVQLWNHIKDLRAQLNLPVFQHAAPQDLRIAPNLGNAPSGKSLTARKPVAKTAVLYADHNRNDREMMDAFFSLYPDIELVRFPNGELLLDYVSTAEDGCFCYVLLDVDMPKLSGIATLTALRFMPATKNTKAILFTHNITDVEREAAINLRAEIIMKPLTVSSVNFVGTLIVEYCYEFLAE